ncbi:MAG: CZB domain-containing protein [Bacillota bacterium]
MWKWKLYSMLFGYESINVEAVASHKTCRLGQWYLASWERFGHLGSFQRLDEPHEKMHQITRRSVELYQEGRLVEAEELVEEVKILSSAILGILDEIAQDIRRNQEVYRIIPKTTQEIHSVVVFCYKIFSGNGYVFSRGKVELA